MTTLLDLIDVDMPGKLTPRERFELFNETNPQVLRSLEWLTEQAAARGRQRIGIATLFEVLRWNYYLTSHDTQSEFKLNNNYRAFYARRIMERHPEWGQIFELRTQHEPAKTSPR